MWSAIEPNSKEGQQHRTGQIVNIKISEKKVSITTRNHIIDSKKKTGNDLVRDNAGNLLPGSRDIVGKYFFRRLRGVKEEQISRLILWPIKK